MVAVLPRRSKLSSARGKIAVQWSGTQALWTEYQIERRIFRLPPSKTRGAALASASAASESAADRVLPQSPLSANSPRHRARAWKRHDALSRHAQDLVSAGDHDRHSTR